MAAQFVDADPFISAMGPAVRQAIGLGRNGHGPLTAWCAAWTVREQVRACNALVAVRAGEATGWVVGITMFNEARGPRRTLVDLAPEMRAALAPTIAEAFAAGIATGLHAPVAFWKALVELVDADSPALRVLAPAVAVGVGSDVFAIRGAARELSRRIARAYPAVVPALVAQLQLAQAGAEPGRRRWLDEVARSLGTPIERAVARAVPDDGEVALLDQLLVAWHASGDPAVEPLIVALGLAVSGARGPVDCREWDRVARLADPGDVARLLEDPVPPTKRVQALARFPPDPRIVARLAQAARELSPTRAAHAEIAAIFARAPAPSTLAHLDAIERRWPEIGAYLAARDAIEEALAQRVATAADPALLAEAMSRTGAGQDVEALWVTHHANPSDLDHRAVLGDALQRIHDPRGELIALQLANRDEPAAHARVESLIAAHGERWIPVRANVSEVRFANGFLVAMRVGRPSEALVESFDRPEWVTVEELVVDTACDLAPLVTRLPLLRRIAVRDEDMLAGLAAATPALRAVACCAAWDLDALEIARYAVIGGQWAGATWSPNAFLNRQHLAATRGLAAIVHLQFPVRMLGPAALVATESGPPETRFVLGRYRGWRGDGWVARVSRGVRVADLAWAGGVTSAFNLATAHVGSLVTAGFRRIRLHAPHRPAAQLASMTTSIRARFPELELELAGGPIDLGAPA